jgi:NADPH:quinone reductase-like Zn-dependent oxidoreductase
VSTDAAGNVVSLAGYNVDDYRVFGNTRCGDNTTGSGTYATVCNSWTSGYFTASLIPVPAAVWMFGSAVGLLGWIRRRAR